MKTRRIVALVLAAVLSVSCLVMTGCNKTKDSGPHLEKRTAVYSAEQLDCKIDGGIGNSYVYGDALYLTYSETISIVRDTEGKEVERFNGYYYQYNGNYEPDDGFIVYAENAAILGNDVLEAPETVADEVDIVPETPKDTDENGLKGEPDEYGVITDEYFNIQVPAGWWVEYETNEVIEKLDVKTRETERLAMDANKVLGIEDGNGYISSILPDGKDSITYVVQTWDYNEETMEDSSNTTITTVNQTTGEIIRSVDMKEALKPYEAEIDLQYLYIYGFTAISDNLYALSINDAFYTCDGNFENIKKIDAGDNFINSIYPGEDTVLVTYYDQNYTKSHVGKLVDGKIEEYDSEVFQNMSDNYYNIVGTSGSRIYMSNQDGVSYYDIETDTIGEELNYLNSDINPNEVNNIKFIKDGQMIMTSTKWDVGNGETSVYLLSRVPEEDLKEEAIVKIATLWGTYSLSEPVIAFNKLNTGVRISLVSYDKYNNEENGWSGAATQLNGDIVSGNLPDIVLLDSSLPVESYFHKGVFVDLNKYIDDEENGLDRNDYLDNLFRANEVDGKLYSAIATFCVATLAAKNKFVGNEPGWTLAEFVDTIEKMPEGMELLFGAGREEVINYLTVQGINSFVDWNTGDTKFDSPEFVKLIEYLKTVPEKGLWEQYYGDMGDEYEYDEEKEREISEGYSLQFWNDKGLIRNTSIYSFTDIRYMYNDFASKDVTLIGFPTDEGNGAIVCPQLEFAISSKSMVKDEAWQFIKYVLESGSDNYGLATNRTLLKEMRERETKGENIMYGVTPYMDYEWMREYGYSEDYINFVMNSNGPYEDSMGDEVMELIENATVIGRNDDELTEIITEELSSFFGGTRSAEDTARVIAGKAHILISEKS